MTEKKVPEVRFKGFSDAWEQRKLKEISNKVTEKNKNNEFSETLTNSAEHGVINQRDFFDKDISNIKNLNGYYIVREDDFVYNPRISNFAPVGPIKRNKLGKTGVMSPLYYVFRTHSIDKKFLDYFFETTAWHKFMNLNGDSGARADRFAIKDSTFKTMPIPYPVLEEQIKIGQFLDRLNNTITLHQRKLNLLKQLKQAYLQLMFPKNHERTPELRFVNFEGEWEQRKLGEIVKRVTRKNKNLESTLPLTISAQYGLVDQVSFFNKQVASKNITGYFLLSNGDFAYNKSYSKDYPFGAVKRLDKYDMGVLSTLYIVFKPTEVNTDFLVTYYETDVWHTEIAMRAAEGARNHGLLNITASDFFDTELTLPSNNDEQKIVGVFFKKFNDTITFYQNKINHLNSLKSAFLKKMFI